MAKDMLSQRFFGEGRSDEIEDFAWQEHTFVYLCVCEDSKPPKVSELSQNQAKCSVRQKNVEAT